jgi:MinD superfamily P-loop ATPase
MIEMPVIDPEKCNGCGLCVEVCHHDALVLIGDIVTVNTAEECDWCIECEIVCITGALSCPFEIVVE